ncbi:MAG: hypothetical protein IJQ72_01350 [Bacilli bacterium]|nr:hypothetical protein [Bacilli bacterium]
MSKNRTYAAIFCFIFGLVCFIVAAIIVISNKAIWVAVGFFGLSAVLLALFFILDKHALNRPNTKTSKYNKSSSKSIKVTKSKNVNNSTYIDPDDEVEDYLKGKKEFHEMSADAQVDFMENWDDD